MKASNRSNWLAAGAVFSLLASTPSQADEGISTTAATKNTKANVVTVDCDAGQRLSHALRRHGRQTEFWITGSCRETRPIVIERSGVIVQGLGDAELIGGGIEVRSALGIELRGFTIRDIPEGNGISIFHGGQAKIIDMKVQNTRQGIVIEGAVGEVTDTIVEDGVDAGILNQAGNLFMRGTIIIRDIEFFGLDNTDGASTNSDDPNIEILISNCLLGFVTQLNSTATFSGGLINSSNNLFHGIVVSNQSSFATGGDVIADNNGGFGLAVGDSGVWTQFLAPFNPMTRLRGNSAGGILVITDGLLILLSDTEVSGNGGPGLTVDNSKASIAQMSVRENQPFDVLLTFTSTVSFAEGNDFATPIACDSTVHTRGTAVCEVEAPATLESAAQTWTRLPLTHVKSHRAAR